MHADKYLPKTIDALKAGARELLRYGFDQDAAALMCIAEFGHPWRITDEQIAHSDAVSLAEYMLELTPQRLAFESLADCAYEWRDGLYFEAMRGQRHEALYKIRHHGGPVRTEDMRAEATEVGSWTVTAARAAGSAVYSTGTLADWLGVFTSLAGVHVFSACTGMDNTRRYGDHTWVRTSLKEAETVCTWCGTAQL